MVISNLTLSAMTIFYRAIRVPLVKGRLGREVEVVFHPDGGALVRKAVFGKKPLKEADVVFVTPIEDVGIRP